MKRTLPLLAWALCLSAICILSGCNGGSNPVTISLSPSGAQSVVAGQTVTITATVANDKSSKGVTWSLTGPGALSAQTTTSVTYTAPSPIASSGTATITVTSVSDTTKSITLTINLQAVSIALTPSAAQTDEQGQTTNVTAAVSNDPMTKGVTWSLTGAGTLSGKTLTAVTYTAPASITTASTATITATSVFDNTKTTTLTINLVPPPSVTTTSLPAGTVGVAYTTTLAATNGVTPYTWSVTVGSLPAGLTLNASTGAITGTPTAYGTSNFTVQVKDANNFMAIAALSIKVNPAPLAITTTSLPNGVVNSPGYSATLQSTGGATPITWTVTAGTLPTGLTLAANGAITGTPTTAGTSNFTVTATDSSTPTAMTASKALSITIIPVLSITTSSLPNGVTGTAYSATLASTGGSGAVTWSVTVGTLPAGLTLNASTGAITGAPTTAGTSNFTVQAADSGTPQQKVTKALSITIVQALVITNSSLPTGAVNSVYSAMLQSSGGTPAVTWAITVGTLPAGLTLNAATGAITGTPTTAGMSSFTVQATDSGTPQQTVTKQFNIIINPVLAITTTSLASGTAGTAYSQPVNTNGGGIAPITWSITLGSLPPGLSLNASTGVISGTPTTATGSPFNFTVRAADSGTPQQTSSKALSISIATAPLSVATTSLPDGVVGKSYTGAVLQSAGGNPPVTWSISVGSLPAGLTLNASTGAITGSPTTAGTTTFTVMATDSTTPTAQTATKQLSIRVNTVLTVTTTSLPGGTVNNSYSATLMSSGGATPITWSITAGSLPPGLTLVPSTGVISGTPNTTTGSPFNFTVQAADSTSPTPQTTTANLSITVTVAPLMITTTSLPNATVNTAYNQTLMFIGGTNPVTWAVTVGTLPTGLVLNASNGNITGTPTTAGTSNFTVKATDSTTPTPQTATANLSITVSAAGVTCGSGHESVFKGQYAFLFQGFDASGPVAIGGVFSADGTGKIALLAGVMDINSSAGVQTNVAINSLGSSFSVGADNRGCLTIATGSVTFKYAISLGSLNGSSIATKGRMIEVDSTGTLGSGALRLQDPAAFSTSAFVGSNFAFGAASTLTLSTSGANRFVVIGSVTVNSSSSITGEEDFNFGGNVDGGSTTGAAAQITAGSLSVSSNGRGSLSLTVAAIGLFPGGTFNLSIYVVSSSEFLFMNIGAQSQTNPLFAGSALKQSGPFSLSSLNANMVLYAAGICSTCGSGGGPGPQLTIGVVTIPSSGNFSFTADQASGATLTSPFTFVGTYTVDASGRVLITKTGSTPGIAVYLVSPNTGFFGSTGTDVNFGFGEPQTGGPSFTNASLSGAFSFGTTEKVTENVADNSGVANFNGISTIAGTSDMASLGSTPGTSTFSQPYSVTNGSGTPGRGTVMNNSGTNVNLIFYIISPSKIVLINVRGGGGPDPNPPLLIGEK